MRWSGTLAIPVKGDKTLNDSKPIIAITMGDPAGVGPEVVVKALAESEIHAICRPLVVGTAAVLAKAIDVTGVSLTIHPIRQLADAGFALGTLDVLDLQNVDPLLFATGRVSAACGRASMEYVQQATELAVNSEVDAIATAPISKEATTLAGYKEQGHLEYIAHLTGATEYATMLATGPLRVVHLTTHYSLREACDLVRRDRILKRLALTDREFRRWGFARPRIAVAALNPHAGEGGLYGNEESAEIAPAVQEAVAMGIEARGPYPADSIFTRAARGEFDVVLAMYHDQGHIPVKVLGFEESISIALGLPILRTSVDHGTAFDIAGRNIADHRSMGEALRTAARLSRGRLQD